MECQREDTIVGILMSYIGFLNDQFLPLEKKKIKQTKTVGHLPAHTTSSTLVN